MTGQELVSESEHPADLLTQCLLKNCLNVPHDLHSFNPIFHIDGAQQGRYVVDFAQEAVQTDCP
jgi:hypothetical protein